MLLKERVKPHGLVCMACGIFTQSVVGIELPDALRKRFVGVFPCQPEQVLISPQDGCRTGKKRVIYGLIAEMFNAHIGKAYEPEVFRPFIGVRLPYLETAMATIIGEVGSVDAYLTETRGVTQAQQDTIREKLLVG